MLRPSVRERKVRIRGFPCPQGGLGCGSMPGFVMRGNELECRAFVEILCDREALVHSGRQAKTEGGGGGQWAATEEGNFDGR